MHRCLDIDQSGRPGALAAAANNALRARACVSMRSWFRAAVSEGRFNGHRPKQEWPKWEWPKQECPKWEWAGNGTRVSGHAAMPQKLDKDAAWKRLYSLDRASVR